MTSLSTPNKSQGSTVLSQTLHSITLTKIRELEKLSAAYESRKNAVLDAAAQLNRQQDRIKILLKGVQDIDPEAIKQGKFVDIARFVQQSEYDPSFPSSMLERYENSLKAGLEVQSREQRLAHLYSSLLCEWMNDVDTSGHRDGEGSDGENSFEIVEQPKQRLQELCDKFDEVCFTPLEVDEDAITRSLQNLYQEAGKDGLADLKALRSAMERFGERFWKETTPFNINSLKSCIKGVLGESLLSDDKQKTLRDFMQNTVVLEEIADVLNMRWQDLENWEWFAGPNGIPVMPRPDLSGKYRIWMDEDVLQAIFTQFVGIKWAIALKEEFQSQVSSAKTWTDQESIVVDNQLKDYYKYYKFKMSKDNLENASRTSWESSFCSALPSSLESAGFEGNYNDADDEDDQQGDNPEGKGIKQQLFRKMATEIFLHKEFHGSVAVIQTDLQWFATALSHSAISTVMEFIGVPEKWIDWFQKYLEAPLNMDSACDGRPALGPRARRRGVPMAHGPEKLLGEMILYFLDFAVYRKTGLLLHRLHDDIWFWGEPSKVAEAWKVMQDLAKTLGLQFNYSKTGSVYSTKERQDSKLLSALPKGKVTMGFLDLSDSSLQWEINQGNVEVHVKQLKKRLHECKSVLNWVQLWNSCMLKFFSNNFGQPSAILGRDHLDHIIKTYQWIQKELFGDGDVSQHLQKMLREKFKVDDIPDVFLFFPEELGGLSVRNPFLRLLLMRDGITKTREEQLEDFYEQERDVYDHAKSSFFKTSRKDRLAALKSLTASNDDITADVDTFISFEKYSAFREVTSVELYNKYTELLSTASSQPLVGVDQVQKEYTLRIIDLKTVPRDEVKWLAKLYLEDLKHQFGGLRLIPRRFLPLAVLEMVRSKTPAWRMVI